MTLKFESDYGMPKGRLAHGVRFTYAIHYRDHEPNPNLRWVLRMIPITTVAAPADMDFAYLEDAKAYARQHDQRELDKRRKEDS